MPIHRARGRISSHEDRQIGDDCNGVEEGGEVKNWRGEIWEVPSDHNTTRFYKGGPREKNFQKKKIGGRGPTGPPINIVSWLGLDRDLPKLDKFSRILILREPLVVRLQSVNLVSWLGLDRDLPKLDKISQILILREPLVATVMKN